MDKKITPLLICMMLASGAGAVEAEFHEFFEEWVALERTFDPAVVELYADDAVIHFLRRFADGTEQSLKLDGKKWKQLLLSGLDVAEQRGDVSEYSDITVALSETGDRATIRAIRYSALKCFTDRAFYVVVERRGAGLRIVEEYGESTAESLCDSDTQGDDLELMIEAAVRAARTQIELPVLVDEEIRLDAIRAAGKTLEYHFVLVNYAAEELDSEALIQNLTPGVLVQVCSRPSLKLLMDTGASVAYWYRGNDANEVATIQVTGADCQDAALGEPPGD